MIDDILTIKSMLNAKGNDTVLYVTIIYITAFIVRITNASSLTSRTNALTEY